MQGSAGQQRVPTDFFANLQVALPTLYDQAKILENVNCQFGKFNLTIDRIVREINLIREYRTRLTADVVTGKVDVREAVKRLPAETEEPLPLDDLVDEEIDDEIPEEIEA